MKFINLNKADLKQSMPTVYIQTDIIIILYIETIYFLDESNLDYLTV